MDANLINLINEIKYSDDSVIYASYLNLFRYLNASFCKIVQPVGQKKLLYRVRCHDEKDNNGDYFFHNISELSYRKDLTNIKDFGRCNEPLQSRFYASNNNIIAFTEVSEIVRMGNEIEMAYHTTSVWKFNQDVLIAPIFEPDNIENMELNNIKKNCFNMIENSNQIRQSDKSELMSFLKFIASEFTKPSSRENKAYLLSSAYSNYLFDAVDTNDIDNKKIDGILYPTCLDKTTTKNLGLNFVFNNSIIGFNNKIEFVGAYRSRLDKIKGEYFEKERIKIKNFNKVNGQIEW